MGIEAGAEETGCVDEGDAVLALPWVKLRSASSSHTFSYGCREFVSCRMVYMSPLKAI